MLGATGMLGHQSFIHLEQRFGARVHGTYRSPRKALAGFQNLHALDLTDFKNVEDLLRNLKPRWVLNCAGIVKKICHDPTEALLVNATLPHFVSKILDSWGGRLLHVSTDCVFSGKRGLYTETDSPDPVDLYGKTKWMGEVASQPHLTIRTSFIGFELGTDRGLLSWFLSQKGIVRGFQNCFWSGLATPYLADLLGRLMFRDEVCGILNLPGERIDKYSLLKLIAKVFDKNDIEIQPVDEPREDKSLDPRRLRELGFSKISHEEMLAHLKKKDRQRVLVG